MCVGTWAHTRIGIFGGTFDPIHMAHLIIAQEAVAQFHLDLILFIPTGQSPHKSVVGHAAPYERLAMVKLAIADNPCFAASSIEVERSGLSYTVDTLAQIHRECNPVKLSLILGGDMALDLPRWHNPVEILQHVDRIIAAPRPKSKISIHGLACLNASLAGIKEKCDILETPLIDISSTQIRHRVAHNLPIKYLVEDSVAKYITEHNLYHTPLSVVPGEKES
jgi:nicotinate-nucleotide adenylyltransferase